MSALAVEQAGPSCRTGQPSRNGRATRPTRPGPPARLSDPQVERALRGSQQGAGSDVVGGRRLRLTRRGRAVLLGLLAAVLVALTVGWGAARAGAAATDGPAHGVTVIVGRGDTLWSIAADVDPGSDRRQLIDRIIVTNDLRGAHIEPGQQLTVPVSDR